MNTLTELPDLTLYYRAGTSDKVYQCRIEPAGERFVVNFAYGRRGTTLNTGTKTNVPVDLAAARRIHEQLVREKRAKGYTEGEAGTPYQQTEKQPSGWLPQLLNPVDESAVRRFINDEAYCAQEKYDGRRMLVRKQGSDITGINKKGLTVGLPVPVLEAMRLFDGDVILDGESVGELFYGFDLLRLDDVDFTRRSYRERLTTLMNLLFGVQQRVIRYAVTYYTRQQKQGALAELKGRQREGIVFKRLDAPYTPGRPASGGSQFKHKFVATLSAVVSRINVQRSVEIRLLNGQGWQPAGNVTIPANQPVPAIGEVVEVQYLYAHRESHVLYQPVYRGRRSDVEPHECVLSQLKYKSGEDS